MLLFTHILLFLDAFHAVLRNCQPKFITQWLALLSRKLKIIWEKLQLLIFSPFKIVSEA